MESGIAVSVILPSLNVGKFVEECIKSVLEQTLTNIEVLCVDAGSTDGTRDILLRYAEHDPRMRIIDSDRRSYGYQINLGIRQAKGEYIGFVDTDDCIADDMYEKLYQLAEKTEKPDFVKGNHLSFADVNSERITWNAELGTTCIGERVDLDKDRDYALHINSGFWAGIYRRSFLENKRICFNDTQGAAFQDTGFDKQVIILAKSATYLDECVYYYRCDNGGSSVKRDELWHSVVDEWEFIEKRIREEVSDKDYPDEALERLKMETYSWNYRRLRNAQYRKLFMESIPSGMLIEDGENDFDCQTTKELLCSNGIELVLLPAGKRCEKLLFLQKLSGRKPVVAVCDNSPEKQGNAIDGYNIESVESVVARLGNDFSVRWGVVSKEYQSELVSQLTGLGISKESISVIDAMPSPEDVIEYRLIKNGVKQ